MQSRTAKFDTAIAKSHTMRSAVDITSGGAIVASFGRATGKALINGYITISRTNKARRTAYFIAQDFDYSLDLTPTGLLNVYGNEFVVYRGIVYDDGTEELIKLGTFVIDYVEFDDGGAGRTIRVNGTDRSELVSRVGFTTPYQIAQGTNYVSAIIQMLRYVYPGIVFGPTGSTSYTTSNIVYNQGQDPWEKAKELAASCNMEIFFNIDGQCVIRTKIDYKLKSIDWIYASGDSSMVLAMTRRQNNKDVVNYWIVMGNDPGLNTVPTAVAQDLNRASKTYTGGAYGIVSRIVQSGAVQSVAQAQDMANGLLLDSVGGSDPVQLVTIVHPAHDIDDVLYCSKPEDLIGGLFVLDSITIPLEYSAGATIVTRSL